MPNIKFNVDMGELRKKINFVRNGLGASKTDLQTRLIRIDITGGKAVLFAANKEMFCRAEMKIIRTEEATDGVVSVLGDKLERLISQVEAEQASFEADAENVEVHVGFLTVNFETYDGSTLKTIEQGVQSHLSLEGLAVDRGSLEEALTCAKSCITNNSIRPDVNHAELRKGRMLSSDGRKIMIYSHEGFPEDLTLKCPAGLLADLTTSVKNIETPSVQVIEGDGYYFIKGNKNEYTLGVRKIERSFPAVEEQFLKIEAPDDEISLDRNALEMMIRGVVLGLPTDEIRVTFDVGGANREAYLEVSAINALGRRSHERVSCGRKATTKVSFPVSFKHVLDTLAVFKGDSVVDMSIFGGKNLASVRDTTEAREVQTIIPFRTDKQIEKEKREAAEAELSKKATETKTTETTTGAAAAADAGDLEL